MSKLGLSEIAPLAESLPLWRTALKARFIETRKPTPVGDEFARLRARRAELRRIDEQNERERLTRERLNARHNARRP